MDAYSNKIANKENLVFTCKKCEDAKRYIERNTCSDLKLNKIASAVDYSTFHLSRKFKDVMGISISEFIIYKRIEMAKELLNSTNLSITEICSTIGYNSLSYFSILFKKRVGLSPNKFRSIKSAA